LTRTRFKRGEFSPGGTSSLARYEETDPLFGNSQPSHVYRPRAFAPPAQKPVLAVTGLLAEARVAAGPGVVVVSSGGCCAQLEATLAQAVANNVCAIISFGISGGLAPGLPAGSALVARSIITETGECFESDRSWSQRLAKALGGAPIVDMAGVDAPIIHPQGKRALHVSTGAVAVDMESHVAARAARRCGLPFAALRVIADPAERPLPHAAVVGMRPDGKFAIGAILYSLLRQPRQVPQLAHAALDAGAAFATLLRSRKMIAASLGFGDFGELLLDVPREDVIGGSLPV
jgi:adenosylhomocysteine nucleosidase